MVAPSETSGSTAGGPLAGLRVVDLTTSYAGPTASMYLADLGADVIKVERPRFGDDARAWGPPFADGSSAWFASVNRNKRSVVINLRAPEGLEILYSLLAGAHVFMENLNPAKLGDLGLDPAGLRSRFPQLIYCAMSGFGLDGPDHDLPGYDLTAQARSGLMSVTGARGGSPQRVSTALSDVVTGMCAALAISAAAVHQASTGEGDLIDVSLLDTDIALMAPRIAAYLAGEPEPAPSGGTDSVLALYQSFSTADRDIVVAVGNDAQWRRFCKLVDLPELAENPALSDNAGRREHRSWLTEIVAAKLIERPAEQWRKMLGEAGIPCSLVQTLSEVVEDPQVEARGGIMRVPGSASLSTVHSPFRLGSIPRARNERFPALGSHTREILEELGIEPSRIEALAGIGAIEFGDV